MIMAARLAMFSMLVGSAWMLCATAGCGATAGPLVSSDVVFEEVDGLVAVEAEHFFKQTHTDVRRWYLTTIQASPGIEPDGDPSHADSASGGAYMEVLPDTRRSHDDKLIGYENISHLPGRMAILYYKVHFNAPGRYYVWGRIYSMNSEDNGMHVGVDGEWPESSRRMQWMGKRKWVWASKQRTKQNHKGELYKLYLDIDEPGEHIIMFAMREDGTEFDKWIMTSARKQGIDGSGPPPRVRKGKLPEPFVVPSGDRRENP